MAVGAYGAEGLAAARLIMSLEHSTLIAPMLYLTPSVQPVLHFFLPVLLISVELVKFTFFVFRFA